MHPRELLDMFRRKGGSRCVEVGRQIQSYLDGQLDHAAAAKVSDHLDACRRCGLTATDYRRLKTALAADGDALPLDSLQRLQALAAELAAGSASGAPTTT